MLRFRRLHGVSSAQDSRHGMPGTLWRSRVASWKVHSWCSLGWRNVVEGHGKSTWGPTNMLILYDFVWWIVRFGKSSSAQQRLVLHCFFIVIGFVARHFQGDWQWIQLSEGPKRVPAAITLDQDVPSLQGRSSKPLNGRDNWGKHD